MHSYLSPWREFYLEKLEYQIHNTQKGRSYEMDSHIFETYKNDVIPHCCHC